MRQSAVGTNLEGRDVVGSGSNINVAAQWVYRDRLGRCCGSEASQKSQRPVRIDPVGADIIAVPVYYIDKASWSDQLGSDRYCSAYRK